MRYKKPRTPRTQRLRRKDVRIGDKLVLPNHWWRGKCWMWVLRPSGPPQEYVIWEGGFARWDGWGSHGGSHGDPVWTLKDAKGQMLLLAGRIACGDEVEGWIHARHVELAPGYERSKQ